MTAAVLMGLIGYFISNRAVFFFVTASAAPMILSLFLVRPDEIDHERAKGAKNGAGNGAPARIRDLLKDRPLMIFFAVRFFFVR